MDYKTKIRLVISLFGIACIFYLSSSVSPNEYKSIFLISGFIINAIQVLILINNSKDKLF